MYKSTNFRKAQPAQESSNSPYASQIKQLKEAFPTWTELDLESLLVEVNGDVIQASNRILEGHAEQWGNVTRKKDKKSSGPTPSHSKDSFAGRDRGDSRGGRGGRGGARGGPGRGGARGVSARGGHHDVNGHRPKPSQSAEASKDASAPDAAAAPAPAVNGEATDVDADAANAWHSSTPTSWGGDTAAVNGATPHPAPAPAAPAHPPAQAPAPGPSATTKVGATPATSKLSWAQIARKPQEKPAPPPAPAPPAQPPTAPSAPTPPAPQPQQPEPAPPAEASEPPSTSTGWEEPTTVQAPTWDDEPRPSQPSESAPAVEETKPAQPEPKPVEEPVPEHAAPAPSPAVQQPSPESPAALPAKPLTPSVQARATPVSHRAPKFKTTDQPVVLPASFGSGVEKIGMQFGSLSLGGEDLDAHDSAPVEQKPAPPAAPEPVAAPPAPAPEPAAPIASPPSQAPLTSGSLFQSTVPQQQPSQQPQPPAQPPHISAPAQPPQPTLTTSLSQPSLSTQSSSLPSATSTSAISPYSQQSQSISQQSLASHQSQPQSQSHHTYGQHGLPTHIDQVQSQQQQHATPVSQPPQSQPAQAQNLGGPSSYFRQPEAPYFHAPTPPAGQNQDSPYGSFGQLGQQAQHQGQGSHLGNFGGADYGYGENQRQQQNFYESYTGPSGFGNRNVLGHDDLKGLPGSQQPHGAPGLPPASAQSSQQHPPSSQASSQGQPNAGQGPQQGYPPPLPYYYPYPQNQYYGSPYSSGYTVPQPFVKYPTVFQGPPGPQSAPSPATKQGPSAVQPQSPYGQGLYGQQHPSNTYDDLGYQHHSQHSVGQNVNVGSALPSSEYGKHQSLYGSGSQGMQGFMGLGQSTGPSSGPPLGQRATGGSPEAAYKPYGGNVGVKDVGAGVGVGQGGVGGVGQGPQGRGGVQQPGQGSFYAQRFAASQAGGPQGGQGQQPQGQGPQGHLGYPQGGSDGSTFYSYQPQRQQGYWQ